jgi:capsule biosynthesis phosphatase
MNYLITAAGKGSRLIKRGIKPPKPLVIVNGIELLMWSLSSFNFSSKDRLYIVTQKKDRVKECLLNKIKKFFPQISIDWLELEEVKNGQLLTAIKAIEYFSLKGNILIHNCDTSYKISQNFEEINKDYFGAIPYFFSEGENWSFLKTNGEELISEVQEKKRISSKCSVGTYFFREADELIKLTRKYILSINKNLKSELYISPVYDYAIKQGKKILAIEASHVKIFGTLEEICHSFDLSINEIKGENASSGHQRRTLVVDIDKTICESPKGNDYSKCEPIEPVCEKLREENNNGTYIILYTSRNVRTFKGNIGLINKYTNVVLAEWLKNNNIPYDEIYFNKPWGFGDLNYIDDKFLSIEEFKSN